MARSLILPVLLAVVVARLAVIWFPWWTVPIWFAGCMTVAVARDPDIRRRRSGD